jgi:hypothetical protein
MTALQIVKQQSTNSKRKNEMSTKQRHPRQDRRGGLRAVVTHHNNVASVGHDKGNVTGGFGSGKKPPRPTSARNAAINNRMLAMGMSPAARSDAGALVAAKVVTPQ